MIEQAFRGKASDLLVDSLLVVNRKGRLSAVRAIAVAYRAALRDLRGWVDVHVRTAVPLTPEPARPARRRPSPPPPAASRR